MSAHERRASAAAAPAPGGSPLLNSNFGEGLHVLVTGGQGYVGVHTVLRLLEEGFCVSVLDNSSNSTAEGLTRVKSMVTPERAANLKT